MRKLSKAPIWLDVATAVAASALLGLLVIGMRLVNGEPALPERMPEVPELTGAALALKTWQKDVKGAGAFAQGDDGGFGWTLGYNDLTAAREDALIHCKRHDDTCKIVEAREPLNYRAFEGTISAKTLQVWNAYTKVGKPKAFAVSEDGSVGFSERAQSPKMAQLIALRNCRAKMQKGRYGYLPDRPCKIVLKAP